MIKENHDEERKQNRRETLDFEFILKHLFTVTKDKISRKLRPDLSRTEKDSPLM